MATILIIEDDVTVGTMLEMYLTKAGYQVLQAEDGKHALELCEDVTPDLLLTDLYLPQMDGEQLVEELRARGIDAPAVIMTAGIDGQAAAERLGCHFLQKPFPMKTVVALLQDLLSGGDSNGA